MGITRWRFCLARDTLIPANVSREKIGFDQRMPLEFVTDSFLPSEKAQGVTGLKKTLLLGLKTGR
jgi:hypothetical protein